MLWGNRLQPSAGNSAHDMFHFGCRMLGGQIMSLSFIALMRGQSVLDALEEDDLLIFCRLSE